MHKITPYEHELTWNHVGTNTKLAVGAAFFWNHSAERLEASKSLRRLMTDIAFSRLAKSCMSHRWKKSYHIMFQTYTLLYRNLDDRTWWIRSGSFERAEINPRKKKPTSGSFPDPPLKADSLESRWRPGCNKHTTSGTLEMSQRPLFSITYYMLSW
jgi:hypothetical protein